MLASCGGPQKFPMSIYKQPCSPVFNRFFDPVFSVYPHSDSQYDCPEITDQDFAEMGVLRCLSDSRTGRDFLQRHGDFARKTVTVSHHFKSLQSKRRLKNLCSINSLSAARMTDRCQDPFDSIAELEGFQTTLKSLTGGEGVFSLQLDHYESAPPTVQRSLEAAYRPSAEA